MKRASELSWDELLEVVSDIQAALYLTTDTQGRPVYDPAKEWSSETIEEVADLLVRRGLVPLQPIFQERSEEEDCHECQNCGQLWPAEALQTIHDLYQRVDPGEPMPSGECPQCGALCHPVEEDS